MLQTKRITRTARRICLAVALAGAVMLTVTSVAGAQVNHAGPYHAFAWGDCTVTVGNVATSTGAAVGGADVTCGHYRGVISAKVDLYRWNGAGWQDVRTSGWYTTHNNYHLSVQTSPPYCGGGKTYWDDVATVNVDGYQSTFDLGPGLGYYPQYAPPC